MKSNIKEVCLENKGSEIEICVKIRTIQEKLNLDYKKDNGKEKIH